MAGYPCCCEPSAPTVECINCATNTAPNRWTVTLPNLTWTGDFNCEAGTDDCDQFDGETYELIEANPPGVVGCIFRYTFPEPRPVFCRNPLGFDYIVEAIQLQVLATSLRLAIVLEDGAEIAVWLLDGYPNEQVDCFATTQPYQLPVRQQGPLQWACIPNDGDDAQLWTYDKP